MTLTLDPVLRSAGIDPADARVIRHAYVREHEETSLQGIRAGSTDDEILEYTASQSSNTRKFPPVPPRFWVVFVPEGGARARLWSVVECLGGDVNDGVRQTFEPAVSDHLLVLRYHLVICWRSPRTWRVNGPDGRQLPRDGDRRRAARAVPRVRSAGARPRTAAGGDAGALVRRMANRAFVGVYLIADTRDRRQYVAKADGTKSNRQRWSAYSTNAHGGNVELRNVDPMSVRFSLLRVFVPSMPTAVIDGAESHFKTPMDTCRHGLNRN